MNRRTDGSPCVLFVDDEEMTRKTFERIASQEFPVLLAGDVAEAIEILKSQGDDIGVLLTDQRRPGGLGVELLEYAREEHPDIVRMLTTAYSELEDAIAAVNRGEIIRYIEKPWSNIDALLIDLRVAMRFHLLEKSNQELMAEKMSAKSRGARLERLQVLAALAAAQPDSKAALAGLESALRSLSDLRLANGFDSGGSAQDLYSGPVEEAKYAILLAERCSKSLARLTGDTWVELSEIKLIGNGASTKLPDSLSEAAELLARASAIFSTGGDVASGSVETSGEEVVVKFNQNGSGNNLLNRWINEGPDQDSALAIADLLRLYFIGFSAGADIELAFDDLGNLSELSLTFSDKSGTSTQDEDWLEDMLILFA